MVARNHWERYRYSLITSLLSLQTFYLYYNDSIFISGYFLGNSSSGALLLGMCGRRGDEPIAEVLNRWEWKGDEENFRF